VAELVWVVQPYLLLLQAITMLNGLRCILIQGCLIDMVGFLLGSFALFSWNLFNLQVLLLFLFVAIVFVPITMLFFTIGLD
jgi:hypothetical protein